MSVWIKILMLATIMLMRLCVRALNRESAKENEYCWLSNSINDLEKVIKEKL